MDLDNLLEELTEDYLSLTRFSYQTIAAKVKTNFATAPLVIEILLILIQMGCEDQSGLQIQTVLGHRDCSQEALESVIGSLMDVLAVKDADFISLHLAQKFYIKQSVKIQETFKILAKEVFDLFIENIDFSDNNKAAKIINRWVENQTKGHIKSIIKPQQLDAWSSFIAVSALHFEGEFDAVFKKRNTTKKTFYKNGKEKIQVETMRTVSFYRYCEVEELNAKLLEIQFKSLTASLVIVLPNKKTGLPNIEKHIAVAFHVGSTDYSKEYVEVTLPKFKIENTVDFKPLLKKAGIDKIFRMEETNLSGIGGNGHDLHVNDIFQKISFEVDEFGAGSRSRSTHDVTSTLDSTIVEKNVKHFTVEHPFVFYVRTSDVVILVGRVVDPNSTEHYEIQI